MGKHISNIYIYKYYIHLYSLLGWVEGEKTSTWQQTMAFNMFGTYCTKDQGFPRTVLRQRRRGHQKFGGDAISESTPVSVAKIYRLGEGIMSSLVQSGHVKAVVLDFW